MKQTWLEYTAIKLVLKTDCPIPKPIFNIHNPTGSTLLNRLRLGRSNLNQHKFNHNFRDWVNPLCTYSLEIESPSHFFVGCHYVTDIRKTLFNELLLVDENTLNKWETEIVKLLLYGNQKF